MCFHGSVHLPKINDITLPPEAVRHEYAIHRDNLFGAV